MKTYKHLFEQLVTTENIQRAIVRASKGKQQRRDVQHVLQNQIYYVQAIQYMLRNRFWHPRQHKAIEINDGICLKKRVIVKPDFVYEQIIHHALVQVLQPLFMRSMYALSCGSSSTWTAFKRYITDLVDVAALKKLVSAHQLKLNKQEAKAV